MPDEQSFSILLDELRKTVHEKGVSATIALLQNARQNVSGNDHIRFVTACVCNQLSINLEQLMAGTGDSIGYARGYIVYFLRTEFQMRWADINIFLDKDQSVLFRRMRIIKDLKQQSKPDQVWLSHKFAIAKALVIYKKSIPANI